MTPDTFEATRRTQGVELAMFLANARDHALAATSAVTLCARFPKLPPQEVARRLLEAQARRSVG